MDVSGHFEAFLFLFRLYLGNVYNFRQILNRKQVL